MDNFYQEHSEFLPKEETNTITEKVGRIKAGIMTYAPSIILSLILVAISALGTLIQFNFQLNTIVWSTFIISLGLRLISNFLSKYVGSNLYYNKALYSDEMQNLKNDFILQGKDIDKNAFEIYVQEYNLECKKRAYEIQQRSKITKLNLKINTLNHKNEIRETKRRLRKIKRLTLKIAEIEKVCTKEYIDKNIRYIKVKYPRVKSCYFLSPAEDSTENGKTYNVNFSKENTKEILKKLPVTALMVFFGALISYDAAMGKANIISILYDVGNMAFNFILGWFVVGKDIASRTMNAFINRLTFIAGYKEYEQRRSQERTILDTNKNQDKKGVEVVKKKRNK